MPRIATLPALAYAGGPHRRAGAFPTDVRRWAAAGWLIAMAAFGGVVGWSVLAPLTSAVVGPGTVAVEGNRKAVQHLQGGIIDNVLVRDGEHVEQGQVLMRLDATEPLASVRLLDGRLDEARAMEARLLAERNGRPGIVFPKDLVAAESDATLAAVIAGQRKLFDVRRRSLEGQRQIHLTQIQQFEARIEGLERQREANSRQLELMDAELKGLETLSRSGNVSIARVRQFQREREQVLAQEGLNLASLAETAQRIGEAHLQIAQIEKAFLQEVETSLQEVRATIYDLTERLGAAKVRLARLEIKAPVTGSIVNLGPHTAGGVISPGDAIMEIVPSLEELVIEARIRPDDIDAVAVGMPVDVRFSSFSAGTAPVLRGKVKTVSADSLIDRVTGMSYFLVRANVDAEHARKLSEANIDLVPGMPVVVMVESGQKTLFQYIFEPIRERMARAMIE